MSLGTSNVATDAGSNIATDTPSGTIDRTGNWYDSSGTVAPSATRSHADSGGTVDVNCADCHASSASSIASDCVGCEASGGSSIASGCTDCQASSGSNILSGCADSSASGGSDVLEGCTNCQASSGSTISVDCMNCQASGAGAIFANCDDSAASSGGIVDAGSAACEADTYGTASGTAARAMCGGSALADYAFAVGAGAFATRVGQRSESSGMLTAGPGVAQLFKLDFRGQTPGSGANESVALKYGPINNQTLTLEAGKAYSIDVTAIAMSHVNDFARFAGVLVVKRVGGTITIGVTSAIARSTGSSAGSALWTLAITDDTAGGLTLTFATGTAITAQVNVYCVLSFLEVVAP